MATEGASSSMDSGGGARTLTAADIMGIVGGDLHGDPATTVSGIAPLHRAEPHHVGFLGHPRYATLAKSSRIGVLLVDPALVEHANAAPSRIVVKNPYEAVLSLLPHFHVPTTRVSGVHGTARIGAGVKLGDRVTLDEYAVIAEGAEIGDDCWIGSHVVVGKGAKVGADSRLYPHVVLYDGAELGARVIVHAGARIGSDGFGYVFRDGAHQKIPHVGRCVVGDDVEIGANTTIDRGSIDDTIIGAGTKVDNLVHIGHNVRIGRLCLIMAQVGIAGSTIIEDGAILAGQVGLSGHLTIGKGARLGAQAGVFGDVPAGETWSGYPARPHRESLRASAALFKLPDMLKKLESLLAERTGNKDG
jgi:UDP-3-O-[3-hydroxymyristoyl] glucosamine N-acyltransferase